MTNAPKGIHNAARNDKVCIMGGHVAPDPDGNRAQRRAAARLDRGQPRTKEHHGNGRCLQRGCNEPATVEHYNKHNELTQLRCSTHAQRLLAEVRHSAAAQSWRKREARRQLGG